MKFSEFLCESEYTLYRMISKKIADQLLNGRSVPITSKFTSFVRDKNHLKDEFGDRVLEIHTKDLPPTCEIIPIQYDLTWFTRSKLHRELLKRVTGRDEQDWWDEFKDLDSIDDEIEALYADEHEIVVVGLTSLDPTKVKIIS